MATRLNRAETQEYLYRDMRNNKPRRSLKNENSASGENRKYIRKGVSADGEKGDITLCVIGY